ncbi:MAG: hypothetical protein IH616_24455 [Gemmatimonadales bacterium]|nr:hypothetical protein [Gemmatimonadales bacterium]
MTRVRCININTAESSRRFLPVLRRSIDLARCEDTAVEIESVTPGLERALDANSAYFSLLNKCGIVEQALAAQAAGCDAAMVLCFLDPAIQEAREVVDIPVIGVGEASMLLACQLGSRFAIVTLDEPKMVAEIEASIDRYGLSARATRNPVVAIDIPSRDWLTRGMSEPEQVVDEVRRKAERCVSDGADVVIIGCVGLGPIVSGAGLSRLDDGEVPVIDCVQAGLKAAEFRAGLCARPGWPAVGRSGIHARPAASDIDRVRRAFGLPAGRG